MRIAVMQPYFFPYAGYFRLFAAVDLFVVLDCVQFPRRGWVHRNQITNRKGEPQWITLPLLKGQRESTRVCDLVFAEGAQETMLVQYRRFPCFDGSDNKAPEVMSILQDFKITPIQYLLRTLEWASSTLGIKKEMILSSQLNIPDTFKAQDRIIEIAKKLGATDYINASGGKALYDPVKFNDAGLSLSFLSSYRGSYHSVLERLLLEPLAQVRSEILINTKLETAGH